MEAVGPRLGSVVFVRAAVALLAIAAGLAWHAAPSRAATTTYFAEYKGDASYHYSMTSTDPKSPGTSTQDITFSWDEKVYADETGNVERRTLVAQGSMNQAGTGIFSGQGNNWSCTVHQNGASNPDNLTIGPGDSTTSANVAGSIPDGTGQFGQVTVSPVSDPTGVCQSVDSSNSAVLPYSPTATDGSFSPDNCVQFPGDPAWIPFSLQNVRAAGYSKAFDSTQTATPIPNANCSNSTITSTRTIHAVVSVGAAVPTSNPPPPLPLEQPPPLPDKDSLKAYIDDLQQQILNFHGHGHADDFCWDSVGFGPGTLEARKNAFVFSWVGPDACEQLIWKYLSAMDSLKRDPPDARYTQIALPERWPGPRLPARSPCAKTDAICTRLAAAVHAYLLADMRTTAIWETLAVTANRWGTAYAAFNTSATAPAGLALQTALLKAYWGELGHALASESRAGQAADAAQHAAHLGRLKLLPGAGPAARRYLDRLQPPGWLVHHLVSDGVVSSAGELRSAWHSLLDDASVPSSIDLKAIFSVDSSAPQVPGETYRSMTLDDLYWIADAVRGPTARATLTKDVLDALGASSASKKHSALESFQAYAKQHKTGELSTLLQTAVARLLS